MNRLIIVCNDLIDVAHNRKSFFDELGLGYLALSGILAKGITAILDLKYDYANMVSRYEIERRDNEDLRQMLFDVFGDREIDCLREDVLKDILAYSKQKIAELEERYED